MAKNQNGPAVTENSKSEFGVRDVIRTMKKNQKAVRTLAGIGEKKPGIAQAIAAIQDEQAKLKEAALKIVAKQIEDALTDDE